MKIVSIPLSIAILAISGSLSLGLCSSALADQMLHGGVQEQDTIKDTGSERLDRNKDLQKNNNADPFDRSDDNETLDAPKEEFKPEKAIVPPRRPLQGGAQDQGMMPTQGRPGNGMVSPMDMNTDPDRMPNNVQQVPQPMPQYNPNDPDTTPDMMLAWDAWHKRVAATIYDRFNFFAKAAFRHSAPLMAVLSYQVTRDGHIVNLNMTQKSNNVLFNVLVYQCVRSLEGDMSVLTFPDGSHRAVVAKAGQFTQNYGQEGFRYITGDKERISTGQ